ncbi:hypothetical protein XENORESO_009346 [Xenotaenia resolanae]|uniref:Secreted protein n=1 Tax=Xenotaenia resolanae TaxID=208358 RepID=A0ABV0VRE4_9TELE
MTASHFRVQWLVKWFIPLEHLHIMSHYTTLNDPQSVGADGRSHGAWFWFCWRSLPVKREFFLSTVATCMLSMRDCCKVNASNCPLLLHAHPGGVNATSH